MKKSILLIITISLASCSNTPNVQYEVSQKMLNEKNTSRYLTYQAKLSNKVSEKSKEVYDYFLTYQGEKENHTDYDGNEHLEQFYCNITDDLGFYLPSTTDDLYAYYSTLKDNKWQIYYIPTIPEVEVKNVTYLIKEYKSALKNVTPIQES